MYSTVMKRIIAVFFVVAATMVSIVSAQSPDPVILRQQSPPSLRLVPVPEPRNLGEYVVDRAAAIALGKALFWDMQVGSDGIQACASCHFHAGADRRTKNQVGPGLIAGDTTFQSGGPNSTLTAFDFPFHQRLHPEFQNSPIIRSINDIASSMGVFLSEFVDIIPGSSLEQTSYLFDNVFNVGGINTRRVEPRNAPTVINAVYNFANFWDGRANNIFNGANPFGPADLNARVWANNNGVLEPVVTVGLNNASLASQAVGPPGSDFEMSARNRPFPKIGKKMLSLTPLAKQGVLATDSVLGSLAAVDKGLTVTYPQLIQQAFNSKYWSSPDIIVFNNGVPVVQPDPGRPLTTAEFTQMEANFSLFFGLSVQLYEATLVSDDTPFDRFAMGDNTALTGQQLEGLDIFLHQGKCINCHGGAEFTNASVTAARFLDNTRHALFETVAQVQSTMIYDEGYYNLGLTLTTDDLGRGGTAPFINPLTGSALPLSFISCAVLQNQGLLPFPSPQLSPVFPIDFIRASANGRFKAPGLRNVELTGPYFHNGGAATLDEVIDFYVRGGNFPHVNIVDIDPEIAEIIFLQGAQDRHAALAAFLKALTDERVRQEMAPFDHPELFVPDGHLGDNVALTCSNAGNACDSLLLLPAVGAAGRPAQGLPPLQPFDVIRRPDRVGLYEGGSWNLDANGNGVWDGVSTDFSFFYGGMPGAVPVAGDWTGNGPTEIGIYAEGYWYLDMNGNGHWDGTPVDSMYFYGGMPGAVPVAGDWNGSGTTKIGIYADGYWYLDMNGNGVWDGAPVDSMYFYGGMPGAIPVTGDWDGSGIKQPGSGKTEIGIYADGYWYLDMNGNGVWDGTPVDSMYFYGGMAGAIPVTGDWDGSGATKMGIYAGGFWYLDVNGNGVWDGLPSDGLSSYSAGAGNATPLAGKW